ncbi:MAG: OmpH family outer membrane protein [Bacteroidales bacterium]|jgi:outer membrane protein|nr:OmpH family outer membrane protein [Bacteroidales bacterium]
MENEINKEIETQEETTQNSSEIENTKENHQEKETKKTNFSKINFYVNIILFIALILVIFCKSSDKSSKAKSIVNDGNSTSIAFINTDTIFNNYELVDDLHDVLKEKKEKYEREIEQKQRSFQEKINNLQSNIQNNRITYEQAQNAEQKLMHERDEILILSERYANDLAAIEYQVTQEITDSIINYCNRYNLSLQADYVLGYTKGGGILVANPEFDITSDVLKGLNSEYSKSKN